MANLPVTVRISTPLPVSVRDLPKLERLANLASASHRVDPHAVTMTQDGNDLVITYEVNAR